MSYIFLRVIFDSYIRQKTCNPKKTVCIQFGSKINIDKHVSMNGFAVRHLGNFVDSTVSDSLDCRYKRSMLIGYINKRISKFGHLQPHILINLFKPYCCSFLDLVRGG